MAANQNQLMGMLGVTAAGAGRFVTTGGTGLPAAPRALGDDASVMMISGVGNVPANAPAVPVAPAVDLMTALKTPIRIGSLELPLWVWLAAALALGGAGGYWLGKKK
jgi:hypothetical protein